MTEPRRTWRPTSKKAEQILGGYFPVLDHGFVSLVDYMGNDESVERAARVSTATDHTAAPPARQPADTRRLIRYLMRHRHTSPFEMVELKFHVCAPIFVQRQWIRHRTASTNENSGRYAVMPSAFYTPEAANWRKQDPSNKQGRSNEQPLSYEEAKARLDRGRDHAYDTYEWMLGLDVARELARIDLPLSTYTSFYWKIDLHNLFHFLKLRLDPGAQWEIRAYAEILAGMVKLAVPVSYEAWADFDLMGARMSRGELEAIANLVSSADGIATRETKFRDRRESAFSLSRLGLTQREVNELQAKITPPPRRSHDLDLETMRINQ